MIKVSSVYLIYKLRFNLKVIRRNGKYRIQKIEQEYKAVSRGSIV